MRPNKKVNKLIEKDLSNYVNIETGETLLSELACNNEKVKITKESDTITITSDEYVVIDSKVMEYIKTILSATDFKRLLCMANMLKTEFNIVFNYNIPHTPDTLSEELELTIDDLTRLIKRLQQKGIVAYCESYKSGYKQKLYMLNPTFARKHKTFNEEMLHIFEDLRNK